MRCVRKSTAWARVGRLALVGLTVIPFPEVMEYSGINRLEVIFMEYHISVLPFVLVIEYISILDHINTTVAKS